MSANGPGLAAEDVWLRYSSKRPWALAGATASVPAGTLAALVGPNGAGKTTLFRVLLGFERPSTGSVSVAGVDPTRDRSRVLESIAYVAQQPALYGSLTAREHHRFASINRRAFDVEAAREALRRVDVPLDVRADALSGGQRVQLALSIASGCHAKVLLLDEPLANLDPIARRVVSLTLADYAHQHGAVVLVSSHLVSDLEGTFDHLVAVQAGRVLLSGPIAEIVDGAAVQRVTLDEPVASAELGRFISRDGQLSSVTVEHGEEVSEGALDRRAATLEEVVLALLSTPDGAHPQGDAR